MYIEEKRKTMVEIMKDELTIINGRIIEKEKSLHQAGYRKE